MNTRQYRAKFMEIIIECMGISVKNTSSMYKTISKLLTEIMSEYENEYTLFAIQSAKEALSDPYYIQKLSSMNQFARRGYIFAVIRSKLIECKDFFEKEKLKIVEHSNYNEDFKITIEDNISMQKERIDISRFIK